MTSRKKDEAKEAEGTLDPKSIEELQVSNELFSLFMRHSPIYTYIKSVTPTESRILQASDNYQKMLGSSSLDIVGKTMEDLFPAGFAAKMTADDWAVVTNGKMLQTEKDLDDRSYITIKFPFVQGDKNMLAGYMFDITERKQAEKAVEKREQLLKEAQQAVQINESAERKRAEEALQEVESKLRDGEDKLRAGENKLREVENKLREDEDKLREFEGKLRAGEDKLREVEEKPREVEEKLREAEDKLRVSKEKLQKVEDKLRAGEDKLRENEDKLQKSEDKLRENEDKLQKSEDKLRENEDKLQKSEDKLRENEDKLQKSEDKLHENGDKLQASEDKLHENGDKLQTSEGKLRKVEEKIREEEDKLRKDKDTPRVNEATLASLKEKELLLHEVNLQAKINLDAVIRLLGMQQKIKGKLLGHQALTAAALSTLENRIKPMTLVHEQLYQSRDASYIDSQDYLSALVSHLRTSLNVPPEIVCSVDATGITLKPDIAVPVGMIVNELATNAFQYAFPKNQPCFGADKCEIMISLERINAEYTLTVDDNGVGLPKNFSSKSTLGLQLVKMLGVDQLGGKVKLNRTHGTRFVLKFNAKQ